jgi:hypothetical protein
MLVPRRFRRFSTTPYLAESYHDFVEGGGKLERNFVIFADRGLPETGLMP